jgi:hypothetical protein
VLAVTANAPSWSMRDGRAIFFGLAYRETARVGPWPSDPRQSLDTTSSSMIFGRPTLMWENAPTPEEFFKSYGFSDVHTLDVSPYQGCSHVHDLNAPEPPPELVGQYDMVMSGGTLEHVFAVSNAIKTAAALVREGGWLIFSAPANNWVDHGFYQLSPTLKFDYFAVNGFEFGESRAFIALARGHRAFPLYPGEGQVLNLYRGRASHMMRVRKVPGATYDRIPTQAIYADKSSRPLFRFGASEPLESNGGTPTVPQMARYTLTAPQPLDGRYAARFQNRDHPSSLEQRPFRSPALVYEDGKLLPWIVSAPAMVKERLGSFHHGPGFVHFSTTDGSDPRSNGRRYEVAFPDMKRFLGALNQFTVKVAADLENSGAV